ncbi:hypothetical protein IAU59_001582 [Kwoniella sp. CBS 9459]
MSPLLPRSCFASSSRLPMPVYPAAHCTLALTLTAYPGRAVGSSRLSAQRRNLSLIPQRSPSSIPFFLPHFGLGGKHQVHLPDFGSTSRGKGKGKEVARGHGYDEGDENRGRGSGGPGRDLKPDPEEEVDDGEWDIRVARAMLHLRDTLPMFFDAEMRSSDMFPPDIYSRNVVLKLPAPLPLKISSLSGYSMAFSLARSGMHALHTDLRTDLERMTFSPSPSGAATAKVDPAAASMLSRKPVPAHRQKQIRIQVAVYGRPRLPPHHEAKWHTSSLYTFSPYSGLITSHDVETIRPLPGEGVAEWLMSRLLGWTSRQGANEGAVPCPSPRTVAVPVELRQRSRLRAERESFAKKAENL